MRRSTTTLAAALLGLGATLTATPALASTAPQIAHAGSAATPAASVPCDVSVFTDFVDRSPQSIYGLGTVACDSGYLPRYSVSVDLFRMTPGGTPQYVTGSSVDCTSSSCTVSSGQYTPPVGNTQYCARISYNDAGTMRYHWSSAAQCLWR